MEDYINIALEPGDAFIDFHFYSYSLGKVSEIARYFFKQMSGSFEFATPDSEDIDNGKTEYGKIECDFLSNPLTGWYKGEADTDIYRFISLMDACVFNQNINEEITNGISSPKFFPHFVGIYLNSKIKNIKGEFSRSWPSKDFANIDLFNYCQYDKINAAVSDEERLHPGMAVYFNNFEFNTSIDGSRKIFSMSSNFKVLALDMFTQETRSKDSPSAPPAAGKI